MKNYKFLVPVLLIVMLIGSLYVLNDTKVAEEKKYTDALAGARDYREKDIRVDAEKQYLLALSLKPSLDLYIEIGEFYWETEQQPPLKTAVSLNSPLK